jgi:hypothetical protein
MIMKAAKTISTPETTISTSECPMTGEEYIESIRDAREVYLYGDCVKDATMHPAFRNSVRMTAPDHDIGERAPEGGMSEGNEGQRGGLRPKEIPAGGGTGEHPW